MSKDGLVNAGFIVVGILGLGLLGGGWLFLGGLGQIVAMTVGGAMAGGSYAKLFIGDDQPPDLEARARSSTPPL